MRQATLLLSLLLLVQAQCYATSFAPAPSFGEVYKNAAFIGVVSISDLPPPQVQDFTEAQPPVVTATVMSSYKGAAKNTRLQLRWDSGMRYDKLRSYNSFMPIAKPEEIKIALPSVGEQYFVFLESYERGIFRDIYGWRRKTVVAVLPKETSPDHIQEGYSVHVFRTDTFTEVPAAKSPYNRQKYTYTVQPQDTRIASAAKHFIIDEPGDYWVLLEGKAVRFRYLSRTESPDWPVRYKVQKDDTLFGISSKFYGHAGNVKLILAANRDVLSGSENISEGVALIIPQEYEPYAKKIPLN